MKRRAFFKSIAKAAAIIALAPQIAFRVKDIEWMPKLQPYQMSVFEKQEWVKAFFWGKPLSYEEYIHSFNRLPELLPEVFHGRTKNNLNS